MVNNKSRDEKGFTIIELTTALSFIAMLLMFIILITMQVIGSFNKGLTMKTISQSSRTVVDQIASDVSASKNVSYHKIKPGTTNEGGMICTDSAVYYWNNITGLKNADRAVKYSGGINNEVYLLRKTDTKCPSITEINHSGVGGYPGGDGSAELLGGSVGVLKMELDTSKAPIITLNVFLGVTSPDLYEDPVNPTVCKSSRLGEFCASSEFKRIIYAPLSS